jgi:hypothetical protein
MELERPREAPPKGCPKNCVFEVKIWPFPCPKVEFLRPKSVEPCPKIEFSRARGGDFADMRPSWGIRGEREVVN